MAARKKVCKEMEESEFQETLLEQISVSEPQEPDEQISTAESEEPDGQISAAGPEEPDGQTAAAGAESIEESPSDVKPKITTTWHITAPTAFSGDIGGVAFARGEADTDSSWMATWFKNKGYRVELKEG